MATRSSAPPLPFFVQGKTAIVTGAGSGINFSFAALLLSHGCNVLLADLSLRPEAQAFVDSHSTGSPRAIFAYTDVTSWTALSAMFTTAIAGFGSIDIVCPGAGIYDPHWSNFWHPPGAKDTTASRDDPDGGRYASIDINVTHPIRVTQMAISHFLNPPAGIEKVGPGNPKRILIISSIAGQKANLMTPIYVAGKHAMNGFVRSLGDLEARIGVRVNGVAPGVIKTPLWLEHPEKLSFIDESKDKWATPEEVAEGMLHCLEDKDLVGGTILEIGAAQTRLVKEVNDPGPSGAGHTVTNIRERYEEVYEWLGQEGWGSGLAKGE